MVGVLACPRERSSPECRLQRQELRLQRPQKCDQSLLIVCRKRQPEFMTRHSASLDAVAIKACWDVLGTEAPRVHPVFQCRDGSIMLERTAIPPTLEGRN